MAVSNTTAEQFSGEIAPSGSSWRLFLFLLVIFSVLFLSWIGLDIGYRKYLTSSIEDYETRIQISNANLNITGREDLVAFYSQIVNLKGILDSHIFGSKIFPFLEEKTNLKVAYATVSLSIPERLIILDGLAGSFDALVQQLMQWQQSPEVEKLILDDNATVNDTVRFKVNITLRPNFFLYSDSYLQSQPTTVPAVPSPTTPDATTTTTTTTTTTQPTQ